LLPAASSSWRMPKSIPASFVLSCPAWNASLTAR
jgi:hypothetical protein